MKTEVSGRKRKILTFVIALFGALLLWMYAIGYDTEISEETFDAVPVEIIGVNTNGYTVADAENFSLQIEIRATGTRSDLAKVDAADFSAYVDISSVTGPGYTTLPINVVVPNGLNAEPLTVSNVTLYVDTFTSRTINIAIEKTYTSQNSIGETAQNIYAVKVYGPESVIGNAEAYSSFTLGNVTADTIHVSGEIKLRDAETKAAISNPYITMSTDTVEVTFTMYGSKNVPVQLLLQGGTFEAEQVLTSVSETSLALHGPLAELSQIDMLSIVCSDDTFEDRLVGTFTASELLAANGIGGKVKAVDPEKEIVYTVELPGIRFLTVTVPVSRIIVYGAPDDGSVVAKATGEIEITVLGTSSAIRAYNEELMTVMVNYRTLVAHVTGEYVGQAEISTGDSRICVDDSVYTVTVDVTVIPVQQPHSIG